MPIGALGWLSQDELPQQSEIRSFLDQLLTFIYTLAHWAGELVVQLVELILGNALPEGLFEGLVDPIGFLVILTVFLAVAEVAKRIAWLVVIVGWILIAIRIVMEVVNGAPPNLPS